MIPWFNSWVGNILWRRDRLPTSVFLGFPCDSAGIESICNAGDLESIPGLERFPWRRERLPTPVFWPGENHGPYSPWNSPGQYTGVGSLSLLQGNLSKPGIEPRSPALQVDSLPAEPPGKPKNTAVGSLSLLQWIFPTQESNQSLLHCRDILYQLSYQRSLHI